MTKVKQIMKNDIMPVSPGDTLPEIARRMSASCSTVMPVCRNGRLLGIITQSRLVTALANSNGDFKRMTAEAIMNCDVIKIQEGIEVIEAAKVMTSNGIDDVSVIRNGNQFAGILTLDHLVQESLALAGMVLQARKKHEN